PNVAFVLANRASTEPGSLTSVGTPSALTCRASISPTTACSGSGRRPATTIAKPSRASANADALPIPLPPPVISATLPFDAMLIPPCVGSANGGFLTISGFRSGGSELLGTAERHSGAPRSGEPGIHEHKPLEDRFRIRPSGPPRNDKNKVPGFVADQAAAASASAARRGKVTVTQVPLAGVLSIVIVPSCNSMIALLSGSPRPVPS